MPEPINCSVDFKLGLQRDGDFLRFRVVLPETEVIIVTKADTGSSVRQGLECAYAVIAQFTTEDRAKNAVSAMTEEILKLDNQSLN